MNDEVEKAPPFTLRQDERGIVHVSYPDNFNITLEVAKQEYRHTCEFGAGKKVVTLVDLTNIGAVEREARIFYGGEQTSRGWAAVALVTKSTTGRIIGNFFLGINRPKTPVKLFDDEKEAVGWLSQFLPE